MTHAWRCEDCCATVSDLRTCMHENSVVDLSRYSTAYTITNAKRAVPLSFAFAQCRQCIDRLAALTDREHERVLIHRHVAVPEFASELDLSRNLGQTFDQTFA